MTMTTDPVMALALRETVPKDKFGLPDEMERRPVFPTLRRVCQNARDGDDWCKQHPTCGGGCQGRGWVVDRSLGALIDAGRGLGLEMHATKELPMGNWARCVLARDRPWHRADTLHEAIVSAISEAVEGG